MKQRKISFTLSKNTAMTKNRRGGQNLNLNYYTRAFINASNNKVVLDVGAAYGFTSLKALKKGAKKVIACDMSRAHLNYILQQTPKKFIKKLQLIKGRFPQEINFPAGSIDMILVAHVLHFMRGKELRQSLKKLHQWLIPGGLLIITVLTPRSHLPFLKYMRLKQLKNAQWSYRVLYKKPLLLSDSREYFEKYYPNFISLFELKNMRLLLKEANFKIKKIGYFSFAKNDKSKPCLGLIATKP